MVPTSRWSGASLELELDAPRLPDRSTRHFGFRGGLPYSQHRFATRVSHEFVEITFRDSIQIGDRGARERPKSAYCLRSRPSDAAAENTVVVSQSDD